MVSCVSNKWAANNPNIYQHKYIESGALTKKTKPRSQTTAAGVFGKVDHIMWKRLTERDKV